MSTKVKLGKSPKDLLSGKRPFINHPRGVYTGQGFEFDLDPAAVNILKLPGNGVVTEAEVFVKNIAHTIGKGWPMFTSMAPDATLAGNGFLFPYKFRWQVAIGIGQYFSDSTDRWQHLVAPVPGNLIVCVNDDNYDDNRGSLKVVVTSHKA